LGKEKKPLSSVTVPYEVESILIVAKGIPSPVALSYTIPLMEPFWAKQCKAKNKQAKGKNLFIINFC
jgi:hypothetical protein